jgi:PKD repeat protein
VNYINVTSAGAAATRSLLSSVGAAPNPAMAIQPVTFNAATTTDYGAQADPIAIVWDFGDGMYDVGEAKNHTYTAAGQYNVRVTATDSAGNSEEQTLPIDVGGGLSENFTLKRVNAGLVFSSTGKDSLRVDASMMLPTDTVLPGATVHIDVAGVAFDATLDSKGRAKVDGGSVKLTRKRGGKGATALSLSVARSSVAAALADNGVISENAKNKAVSLPVIITIGDNTFTGLYAGTYSARSGKVGRVK